MSGIEDWEPVPAENNANPPVGAPENHDRSDVNDIAREMMSSNRADWEGSATGGGEWRNLIKGETLNFVSGTVVDVVGVDVTSFFTAGRKIRVLHSSGSPGTDAYCFVASSAFTTNTRITVENFDSAGASEIGAAVDRIQIHNAFGGGFGIRSGAFETSGGSLYEIPASLTAAGINAAITAAVSSGKIVLLDADTYNLEAAVVMVSGVSLQGRGMRSSTSLKLQYDGYAITSAAFVGGFELRDFEIDGNALARAAGGGISLGDRYFGVLIENVSIKDAWEHGLTTLSPFLGLPGSNFRNVEVLTSGNHSFNITDPLRISTRNYYSELFASAPGSTDGEGAAGSAGVFVEGECTLTDITVSAGASVSNVGIKLEQVGVAGTPEGGNRITLNGFRVLSTSAAGTGLFVGGTRNVISNGYVEVTGASAKALVVDGRGGSPEQALDNHISGVRFQGGLSCTVAGDALRTEIHSCVFDGQSSVGLAISGNDTIAKSCTVMGGQATGIQLTGGALNAEISGCTIRDTTADGINVQSGSNDSVISGCTLRDIGGDGIQVDSGASRTRVVGNVFDTITVSDVNDSGTDTVIRYNVPQAGVSVVDGAVQGFGVTEVVATNMNQVTLPSPGANGTRRFLATANIGMTNSASNTITSRMRMGQTGTATTDAVVKSKSNAATRFNFVFREILTPLADDVVSMTLQADGAASNSTDGSGTVLQLEYLDS